MAHLLLIVADKAFWACVKSVGMFRILQYCTYGARSMFDKERSGVDRRSGADRRRIMNIDYWLSEGIEQRRWRERRSEWIRVSQWSSVSARDLKI